MELILARRDDEGSLLLVVEWARCGQIMLPVGFEVNAAGATELDKRDIFLETLKIVIRDPTSSLRDFAATCAGHILLLFLEPRPIQWYAAVQHEPWLVRLWPVAFYLPGWRFRPFSSNPVKNRAKVFDMNVIYTLFVYLCKRFRINIQTAHMLGS